DALATARRVELTPGRSRPSPPRVCKLRPSQVSWSDRSETWRAAYDGLGRRIWREYGGQRTDFYWDGDWLAGYYATFGPTRLYPRTFLGPRFFHLMDHGPATLTSLGLPYRRLAKDAYEVDLVERPWTADAVTLKN